MIDCAHRAPSRHLRSPPSILPPNESPSTLRGAPSSFTGIRRPSVRERASPPSGSQPRARTRLPKKSRRLEEASPMPDGGDVVIVGGGVMGCASALALAKAGAKVVVLERSIPGAEASSAAAGILGAQAETSESDPNFELAREGRSRYPGWSEQLKSATGIDIGYRQCGILRVAFDEEAKSTILGEAAWQH